MVVAENNEKETFDVLEKLPSLVVIISAMSVVLATARQFGFFATIDFRLLSFFSLEDLIRNSLTNLPLAIVSVLLGPIMYRLGAYHAKADRAKGFSTADVDQGKLRQFLFRRYTALEGICTIGLVILISVTIERWYIIVVIIVFNSFIQIMATAFRSTFLAQFKFAPYMINFSMFVIMAALGGIGEASQIFSKADYFVTTDEGSTSVFLLKVSSDFLLVSDGLGKVSMMAKDNINELSKIEPPQLAPALPVQKIVSGWWPTVYSKFSSFFQRDANISDPTEKS